MLSASTEIGREKKPCIPEILYASPKMKSSALAVSLISFAGMQYAYGFVGKSPSAEMWISAEKCCSLISCGMSLCREYPFSSSQFS